MNAKASALRAIAATVDVAARAVLRAPWRSIGTALAAAKAHTRAVALRDALRSQADAIDPPPAPIVRGVPVARLSQEHREGDVIVFGGDASRPTWAEYVDAYAEGAQRDVREIRAAIEHAEWIGRCGDEAEIDGVVFECSSGRRWRFTHRAWGDLMQAIVDRREGHTAYAWRYS